MRKLFIVFLLLCSGAQFYAQHEILFDKINDQYYYIESHSMPEIAADIKSEYTFTLYNDESNSPQTDSLMLLFNFYPNRDCDIKSISFPGKYGKKKDWQEKNIEAMIGLSVNIWRQFVYSHPFNSETNSYAVEEFDGTYLITEHTGVGEEITYINKNCAIDSIMTIGKFISIIKPSFEEYNGKLLFNSAEYYTDPSMLSAYFQFEFAGLGNYIFPKLLFIKEKWSGGEMEIRASFKNSTLNKMK